MSIQAFQGKHGVTHIPAAPITTPNGSWAGTAIPAGTVYALLRPLTVDAHIVASNVDSTGGGVDPAQLGFSAPVNAPALIPVEGNTFLNVRGIGGAGTLHITWLS